MSNLISVVTKTNSDRIISINNIETGHLVLTTRNFSHEKEVIQETVASFPTPCGDTMGMALRYLDPSCRKIVFERPPCVMELSYINNYMADIEAGNASHAKVKYNIPIPWTYYIASLSPNGDPIQIFVLMGKTQINDLNQNGYLLPLPNFYVKTGKLCRSPNQDATDTRLTINSIMNTIFNEVWASNFNYDLTEYMTPSTATFLGVKKQNMDALLDLWQKRTLVNIMMKGQFDNIAHWNIKQLLENPSLMVDMQNEGFHEADYFISRLSASFMNFS